MCRAVAAPQLRDLLSPSSALPTPMRPLSLSLRGSRAAGIGSYLYVPTYVCARLSLARLLTTRAVPTPFGRPNVYVYGALRLSSTLLSSRAITCTEYNLFSKLSSFRILFASKCHVKFYFTKTVALICVFEFLLNLTQILLCQNGYNLNFSFLISILFTPDRNY